MGPRVSSPYPEPLCEPLERTGGATDSNLSQRHTARARLRHLMDPIAPEDELSYT